MAAVLRHRLFAAALVGAFVGGGALMVSSLIVALAVGAAITPPLLSAIAAGAFVAVVTAAVRNFGGLFVLTLAHIAALSMLSFGKPFGESLTQSGAAHWFALLIYGITSAAACRAVLNGLPHGLLNRRDMEHHFIRLLWAGGFLFFGLMVTAPFLIMLLTSLKSQQALLQNPLDFSLPLDKGASGLFRSYLELFEDYHFGVFLANTAFVSAATVLLTLMFSVPGAYAVARLRFRGKKALARSVLLIYMVPAIVLVIPLYALFSSLGIRNSYWGLLIAYPATTIPVALYMLQGYFRELPSELEEAGLVDGLSRWRVIRHITLPLSLPALSSVSLYVFMIAWNEFLFAFMFLDDPKLFTLSRGIVSLNSSEVPRQHLMAGAVIATVPILVLFLTMERFLVRGLTAGGVKG